MLSAAIAVAIAALREARAAKRIPSPASFFWLVTGCSAYTLVDNAVERPHGVIIASCFVAGILLLSAIGPHLPSDRAAYRNADVCRRAISHALGEIRGKRVNLVPLRVVSISSRKAKANLLSPELPCRRTARLLHVELNDDRSEFTGDLRARVRRTTATI